MKQLLIRSAMKFLVLYIFSIWLPQTLAQDSDIGCYGEGIVYKIDAVNLVEQTDKFAMSYFYYQQQLNYPKNINFVVSPFSLWTLLNLVSLGAEGPTHHGFSSSFVLNKNEAYYGSRFLQQSLKAGGPGAQFIFLDKIYFNSSLNVHLCPEILNFDQIDFSNPSRTARRINQEFRTLTDQRTNPFDASDFTGPLRMLIPDAVHFEGSWVNRFDPSRTEIKFFFDHKGTTGIGQIPMMKTTGEFLYANVKGLQAQIIELPFENSGMSLVVILPHVSPPTGGQGVPDDNFEVVLTRFTYSLSSLLAQMNSTRIDISLPKFKLDYKHNAIEPILGKTISPQIFDPTANFSSFSKDDPLFISKVTQSLSFEINEEGISRALSTSSGPFIDRSTIEPVVFNADRPFIFIVRNKKVGVTLITGMFVGPNDGTSVTKCNDVSISCEFVKQNTDLCEDSYFHELCCRTCNEIFNATRLLTTTTPQSTTLSTTVQPDLFPNFNPVPECGKRFGSPTFFQPGEIPFPAKAGVTDDKIFGGYEALKNSWPWMALLGKFEEGGISWKCGGSLINSQWILTAAHCLLADLQIARLGEHDTEKPESDEQDFWIELSLWYPGYQASHKDHDIGLVKISPPQRLPFTPVCLPWDLKFQKGHIGEEVLVTGWGANSSYSDLSTILKEASIEVFNPRRCIDAYSELEDDYIRDWPRGIQRERIICAGDRLGKVDTCQGDSGGPMVLGDHEKFTIIGIVSTGIGCGLAKYPGIYTPVYFQQYLSWVKETAFNDYYTTNTKQVFVERSTPRPDSNSLISLTSTSRRPIMGSGILGSVSGPRG